MNTNAIASREVIAGQAGLSDADRQLLRDSVREFLASRWPADKAVERASNVPAITTLWGEMATQSLTALGTDPHEGGLREIFLVFEELGRASCPAPMLGAVCANLALARDSSDAAKSLLADLHAGRAIVAAAFGAFDGDHSAGRAEQKGGALTGNIAFVEGSAGATHFLVFTNAPAGVCIVVRGASGVSLTDTPGLAVPALSTLSLVNAPAANVAVDKTTLQGVALIARLACAARALGAAQRAFELAVEHAKVRKQFGQLIGSFQAIQHKLANSLVNLEGSRLTLEQAAAAYDGGMADWRVFGASALAFAGPALREVAVQNQRALGAIGYAEEHEAPRHFRRVHADVSRFGGSLRARAERADHVLRSLGPEGGDANVRALPPLEMGQAAKAFRAEIRDWLAKNWDEVKRAAYRAKPFKDRGWDLEFSKLMGRDGWIGVGWPKEFGGQGRSPSEHIAFITEMANAGTPVNAHNVAENIVAPALFKYGTKEQQAEWLPKILRGEVTFGLGYSEPEAGSDLASLRTRAVRDGEHWVINGQKLWSTGADKAEYMWLAVRTDPAAKKHAGISVFMVNLRSPGITIRPSMAMYGKTFSAHFYDDVRVPDRNRVGAANDGWNVITGALASERVMIGASLMALLEKVFQHLVDHVRGQEVLRSDPVVRDRLGGLAAELEVARQFQLRNSRLVEEGRTGLYEAAMGKVFSGELQERIGQAALDILGSGGLLSEDAPGAPVAGEMEQVLRHSIMGMVGGGTSEIQRNIIALRGLELPR